MADEHFIEIDAKENGIAVTYRFYGLGRWKVNRGQKWHEVNATFVPANVLHVAAAHCSPPLVLSEKTIAALCGSKAR